MIRGDLETCLNAAHSSITQRHKQLPRMAH